MKLMTMQQGNTLLTTDITLKREVTIFAGIVLFAFLTAIGAYIRIPLPFSPVPMTMQVFFVLLCVLVMGPVYGTMSQLTYLGLGVAGMPMFTLAGSGFAHLLGPTGGYILGFIIVQAVAGTLLKRNSDNNMSLAISALAMAIAISVIYFFGALHLKVITGLGLKEVLLIGVIPFIPGEIIKAAGAIAVAGKIKSFVK